MISLDIMLLAMIEKPVVLDDGGNPARPPAAMIAVVGLTAWLACLVLLPASVAVRVFLGAPLVIVPALLGRLPRRSWIGGLAGWPALACAGPLALSFGISPGGVAMVLATPWLALSGIGLAAAIHHGWPRLPGILRPGDAGELGVDVALGFLAVGTVFVLFDRLGLQPLDFPATIILLTGVHFHVAGFGLLVLASLLTERRVALRASVLGIVVGMPVTAAGFVLGSSVLGAIGGFTVGLSGIGVGLALLPGQGWGPGRWLRVVAGACFLAGMPLGIGWALGALLGVPFLDIETMVRTHGILNAGGVMLASLWPDPS